MTSAQNHRPRLSGNKQQLSRHLLHLVILLLLFSVMLAACGNDKDSDSNDQQQTDNSVTEDSTPRARVTVSRAAVYLTPDREASTVLTLLEGDELPITGQTAPDALGAVFYFVQIGDQFGWILSSQVETSGNIAALPVYDDPLSNNTDTDTSNNPTESLDLTPENTNIVLIRTTIADTPMYAAPNANSEILVSLVQDVEFLPIYQTPPDNNGIIYYGAEVPLEGRLRVGWLASTNVEITGDTSTLVLIVSPTPTLPVTAASTAIAQDPTTSSPNPSLTITSSPEANSETPTTAPTQQSDSTPIAPTLTLEPTITTTPLPSITPTALIREIDPPIDIAIPDTWDSGHFVIAAPITTPGSDTELTVSVYEGPLPNGASGTIWAFSFSSFSNLVAQSERFDLYPDANLILRAILFSNCNIGLDIEERNVYQIGQHQSIGARYVAVGCEDNSPDIGGWFAALPVNGRNYVFFVGVEPPDRELENANFFQDLLNTVEFLD